MYSISIGGEPMIRAGCQGKGAPQPGLNLTTVEAFLGVSEEFPISVPFCRLLQEDTQQFEDQQSSCSTPKN